MSEEWLEIRARTQDDAVAAAVEELGLSSAEQVQVDVVEEPQKGLLGFGGKDGVFRVSKKQRSGRRRRRRGRSRSDGERQQQDRSTRSEPAKKGKEGRSRPPREKPSQPRQSKATKESGGRSSRAKPAQSKPRSREPRKEEGAAMPDLSEQASVVNDFLVGLLDAFGLEGTVETSVKDEDIIIANVTGEQAEALIGPKGSILQAILELTRTVVQRKTQAGARIRLDIGGYTERRRAALKIYAGRLAEQVLEDGEEVMLEPMNPADRKAVHDVIAEIEGVRSYSEGEEPRRSVVISPTPTD